MTNLIDSTIFDKKPKFLGVFVITSLIGIFLITFSVFRASQELEIIHEVDKMSEIIRSILGKEWIERLIQGESNPDYSNSTYEFFVISDNDIQPKQSDTGRKSHRFPKYNDLESTRVNPRGGYYEVDGKIHTWVKIKSNISNNHLLVAHEFKSTGNNALMHVYRQRMIIPVFFYIWLMVWVTLIFNHLLQKLKARQNQMKHMALHDALTGLPNRTLMEDRFNKLIQTNLRNNTKFACSMIDLDGFKAINDRLGHAYGDEILQQASKRLESVLRESDTAARLGGDEFIVLLSGIDENAWHAAFIRILTILAKPYNLLDKNVTVGASIGVSIYAVHGDNMETLMRHADQAMYAIKSEGGGISMFEYEGEIKETKSAAI